MTERPSGGGRGGRLGWGWKRRGQGSQGRLSWGLAFRLGGMLGRAWQAAWREWNHPAVGGWFKVFWGQGTFRTQACGTLEGRRGMPTVICARRLTGSQ